MRVLRPISLLYAATLAVACDRSKQAAPPAASPPGASVAQAGDTTPPALEGPHVLNSWPVSVGPVLLSVTETSPDRAHVVGGDSVFDYQGFGAANKSGRVFLFGREGRVRIASLSAVQLGGSSCWTGSIVSGGAPLRGWTVGFVVDSARPIALDSMGGMGRADSGRLVAAVTRLASVIPADSADHFTGLPFVVQALWRFKLTGDTVVVVATLRRQLNQEAMPLQERTLIVAEMDSSTAGDLVTAYSERSEGAEETIEAHDLLGAAWIEQPAHPVLILSRDFGDNIAFGLVERSGARTWRVRWTSARRHC